MDFKIQEKNAMVLLIFDEAVFGSLYVRFYISKILIFYL